MKKSRLLCIALASILVLSAFPGCKGDNNNPSKATDDPHLKEETTADLRFIRPGHDSEKADDPYNIAMKDYEEKYGGKVEIETAGYDTWIQKVFNASASESPIDVISGTTANYPFFAAKKYTQPIEQYLDLNNKEYISKQAAEEFFKFQGQIYLAPGAGMATNVLYYNKGMIADAGLEDPYEIYQKGEWNFDTFATMCKKLSKDTNNDGKNDVWGLANWYSNTFLAANHTAFCKINEEGKYELNFDDPALMTALKYAQDAYYTSNWRGLEGDHIFKSFYKGKNAFVQEYSYKEADDLVPAKENGDFDFEYGVVPMPYGPDNKEKTNIGDAGGYGIGTGSKSPYHAAAFIDMGLKQAKITGDEKNKTIPPEHAALYEELGKNVFSSQQRDSAIDGGSALLGLVCGGKNIQTSMDTLRNVYQGYLDDANDAGNE